MIVTDLKYSLESLKVQQLNWLCQRVSGKKNFQNVIITDGMEGYGKSTITSADAYYMAYCLRRELVLFFDLDALSEYALRTEDKVILWDDAAFAGLSMEAYNQKIIQFIKILLLARKKRHTYFINIQEIWRLKEILVGRAIAMNHVYSPDGNELGKYCYYNEYQLKWMHSNWMHKKKKTYKYYSFKGGFPDVLYRIFDEKEYNDLKDQAIQTISGEENKYIKLIKFLRYKAVTFPGATDQIIKNHVGINSRTIRSWKKDAIDSRINLTGGTVTAIGATIKIKGAYIKPKNLDYLSQPFDEKLILFTYRTHKKAEESNKYDY